MLSELSSLDAEAPSPRHVLAGLWPAWAWAAAGASLLPGPIRWERRAEEGHVYRTRPFVAGMAVGRDSSRRTGAGTPGYARYKY